MKMPNPLGRLLAIAVWGLTLNLTASATADAARNFGAEIADVTGPVFVITKDTNNILNAAKGQRLVPGDAITTGPEGEAEILYDDGNLTRLDANSRLMIEKLDIVEGGARETGIRLELGRVKNAVSKLGNKRSHFEVHSASAVAGVTGTPDWVVALTGDPASPATEVDLLGNIGEPGEVYCEGIGGTGRQMITSGMRSVVQPGMPPTSPFTIDPERLQSLMRKMPIKTPKDVRDLKRMELDKTSGAMQPPIESASPETSPPAATGSGSGSAVGSGVGAVLGAAGTAAGAMAGAEAAKVAAGAAAAGVAGSVAGSVAGAAVGVAGGLIGGDKKEGTEKPAVAIAAAQAPEREKETKNLGAEQATGKIAAAHALSAGSNPLKGGEAHTIFLNSDGTLLAWGGNDEGQLGDGTDDSRLTPVPVKGPEGKGNLDGIVAVTAGRLHTAALKKDGSVWTWGNNDKGQLGNGSTDAQKIPVQVKTSSSKQYLEGIVKVAAGALHTAALKQDGSVWAWGYNDDGQLGDDSYNKRRLSAAQVKGEDGDDELNDITAIAAGNAHTLALKKNGTVWAWGNNDKGQLGDGSTSGSKTPVQVKGLKGMIAIVAGAEHSLALKGDGSIWAWGNNSAGQLGDKSIIKRSAPVQVRSISGITAIAAGENHSVALKGDGTVWTWGSNSAGQLGIDLAKGSKRLVPALVEGLSGASAVGAGNNHTVAFKRDGTLWAWGNNNNGQLGDNSKDDRLIPVQVNNP